MTKEQAKKLQSLHENGYVVIDDYDGQGLYAIIEVDEENKDDWEPTYNMGDLLLDKDDGNYQLLTTRSISEFIVAAPIDWLDIIKDSKYDMNWVKEAFHNKFDITDYVEDLHNAYDEAGD